MSSIIPKRSLADPTILELVSWICHILWIDVKVITVIGALFLAFIAVIVCVGGAVLGVKREIDAGADNVERRRSGEHAQRGTDEEMAAGFREMTTWEAWEEEEEVAECRHMRVIEVMG